MHNHSKEFNLQIDPELNEIFDENNGNSFLAMRRLKWNDTSPYKLDLRRWIINSSGEEVAGKGFSFLTEEGPHELVNVLLKHNYGRTKDVLNNIKYREDFAYNIKEIVQDLYSDAKNIMTVETNDEQFYDPKELFNYDD